MNGEAGACNVEYSTTIDTIIPINLPKVSAEGSNSLEFTSTKECYPDFDKEIKIGNLLNGCKLNKGSDEVWADRVSVSYSFGHVTLPTFYHGPVCDRIGIAKPRTSFPRHGSDE